MSVLSLDRIISISSVPWRAGRVEAGNTTGRGRDKSGSPHFRKPMLALGFLRAGRSGTCRLMRSSQQFQGSFRHQCAGCSTEGWL